MIDEGLGLSKFRAIGGPETGFAAVQPIGPGHVELRPGTSARQRWSEGKWLRKRACHEGASCGQVPCPHQKLGFCCQLVWQVDYQEALEWAQQSAAPGCLV